MRIWNRLPHLARGLLALALAGGRAGGGRRRCVGA